MTSDARFVGFEKKPEGLEEFLISEGYVPTERKESEVTYRREDGLLVELIYEAQVAPEGDEDESSNWAESGFQIVADLSIIFPSEHDDYEEGLRIASKTARRFKAVFYDSNADDYFKLN
jgi:hypothetical protein